MEISTDIVRFLKNGFGFVDDNALENYVVDEKIYLFERDILEEVVDLEEQAHDEVACLIAVLATNPAEYYGYSDDRKSGNFIINIYGKNNEVVKHITNKVREFFDNFRGFLDGENSHRIYQTTLEQDEDASQSDDFPLLYARELAYSYISKA